MKTRVDPWPSLTDLFAALLIGTFGALMLSSDNPGSARKPRCVDLVAEEIREEISRRLVKHLGGKIRVSPGGDDVHVDVYLNFELNLDEIRPEDREKLRGACTALRELFRGNPRLRQEVEIWIEGHTDSSRPSAAATERDANLFNWRLSSNRAASVLYEFSLCGVAPASHPIRAIGYADTEPLVRCPETPVCPENRRTTFRIRVDKAAIARRAELRSRTDCLPPVH